MAAPFEPGPGFLCQSLNSPWPPPFSGRRARLCLTWLYWSVLVSEGPPGCSVCSVSRLLGKLGEGGTLSHWPYQTSGALRGICPERSQLFYFPGNPQSPPVIASGDPWPSLLGPDWLSPAQPTQGFSPGAFPWIRSMGGP